MRELHALVARKRHNASHLSRRDERRGGKAPACVSGTEGASERHGVRADDAAGVDASVRAVAGRTAASGSSGFCLYTIVCSPGVKQKWRVTQSRALPVSASERCAMCTLDARFHKMPSIPRTASSPPDVLAASAALRGGSPLRAAASSAALGNVDSAPAAIAPADSTRGGASAELADN